MESINTLHEQWQQTPRVRMGALVIFLIISYLAIDNLSAHKANVNKDLIAQGKQLQKLQHISQQNWQQKASETRANRVQHEQQLWQAESQGLAQAKIQSWLNQKLRIKGLKTNVSIATSLPNAKHIWQVTAEIKGTMTWQELTTLLTNIELNPKRMVINSLNIQSIKQKLRVELQYASLFQATSPSSSQ